MPHDSEDARIHLVWRIQPKAVAAEHLLRSNGRELREASATDNVAVLYAESPNESPVALTWQDFCEDGSDRRLLRETASQNRFDRWFARNRNADVWTLATVWQFYRDWVEGFNVPDIQTSLQKGFTPSPFLDTLLAISHGWLLWGFQVDLICHAINDEANARRLAKRWRLQHWERLPMPFDAILPDGTEAVDALRERSWKELHDEVMYFGEPDLRLAYMLQRLA